MDVYVVALFPEIFESFARSSIVGRAVEEGRVKFHGVQVREFATSKHRTTDDTPYGGGSGMVMMAPPIVSALESLPGRARDDGTSTPPRRILLGPQGALFTQRDAERLAKEPAIAFVCGRYEGVDERVRPYVDEELSLGDFVLTGGEVAALAMCDAIVRLLPGVLGNEGSLASESHGHEGLLEYPQYTRPAEFRGAGVPPVLLSGDHGRIAKWRRWHGLRRTRDRRPDLFAKVELDPKTRKLIDGEEP